MKTFFSHYIKKNLCGTRVQLSFSSLTACGTRVYNSKNTTKGFPPSLVLAIEATHRGLPISSNDIETI